MLEEKKMLGLSVKNSAKQAVPGLDLTGLAQESAEDSQERNFRENLKKN